MADSFASFAKRLDIMMQGLRDPQLKQVMAKVGKKAQDVAEKAASSDLGGDPKFSGWKPTLDTKVVHVGEGRIRIQPTGPSAGPWTVAESGRHPQAAFQGPSINQRTGTTSRTKSGRIAARRPGRARRYNGNTAGKGTATKAAREMDRVTPPIFEEAVRDAIRKAGL